MGAAIILFNCFAVRVGIRNHGIPLGVPMKADIHPQYNPCQVRCLGCSNTFVTRSTRDEITVEVCANCHGFYTGKQKLMDTAGRVERFNRKYGRS
jgi:large subunit ribosomal protein L31